MEKKKKKKVRYYVTFQTSKHDWGFLHIVELLAAQAVVK